MFANFISRILAAEQGSAVNRQASTMSDVIENSGTLHISDFEKYEKDIEALRVKYGGFISNWTSRTGRDKLTKHDFSS